MKIIAQAPTRISLFGGGTDLPVFYKKHGGLVISMAINLYQYIELTSGTEHFFSMPENGSVDFYKAFFTEFDLPFDNFNIKASSDAPIQSGLGSSASAAVALVAALARVKEVKMSQRQIAEKAWEVCNKKLGLYSGKQDEYAAAFGEMSVIRFSRSGVRPRPVWKSQARELSENILLFYTGSNRKDAKIQEGLKNLSTEKENALSVISELAEAAISDFEEGSYTLFELDTLADLLNQSWDAKKKSNNVTTPHIDLIYNTAIASGALAGKGLGSGGGGFMAFLIEPEKQAGVIAELEKIPGAKHWDYNLDFNGVTTRIL